MDNPDHGNQLTKISNIADLRKLQELYLRDWPKHCVGYFWLDNYLRWKNTKHFTIYTLLDDWQSDGLFILVHRYQLYFSNLSGEKLNLKKCLSLLNWSNGFKVSAIHQTHHHIYKELLAELKISLNREMVTLMYHLPCEEAKRLHLNCPAGYYVDKVYVKDADLINDLWPARHPGSRKLVEMLIERNNSIGLYEKETKTLSAWCLRLQSGFLGALQVVPTHQGRGLGLMVAAAISLSIAQEFHQDVTALVNPYNTPACRIFERLHFSRMEGEHYYWSMSLPQDCDAIKWLENE